jgi:hypothetical protein
MIPLHIICQARPLFENITSRITCMMEIPFEVILDTVNIRMMVWGSGRGMYWESENWVLLVINSVILPLYGIIIPRVAVHSVESVLTLVTLVTWPPSVLCDIDPEKEDTFSCSFYLYKVKSQTANKTKQSYPVKSPYLCLQLHSSSPIDI